MLIALTRPVPRSIVNCELTHVEREPIDWELAAAQHAAYEDVLRRHGCDVRQLAGDDAAPDSVFIEDTAVVVDECAVITRPGALSRRREIDVVAAALREHRSVSCIDAPGTLDGGDVLVVGKRVFVGDSSRTNGTAARQLARVLAPYGYRTTVIAVRGVLHLKSAVTALSDDRVLLNPDMIDASALGDVAHVTIDPAEPMAANVVALPEVILCPASAPRTRRRIEKAGYDTISVDASELAKAEGALTCCSILLRAR